MKGKHKFKERLLAFVLAFAMIMGTVIQPIQLQAAGNQEQELDGQNFENNVQDDGGVPAPTSLGDEGEPTEPGNDFGDGSGGTNEPVDESYTINVYTSDSEPYYQGALVQFAASVTGTVSGSIDSPEISWSCTPNSDGTYINDQGLLTIGENAQGNITVIASYQETSGNMEISVTPAPTYNISGNVKAESGIPGVTVQVQNFDVSTTTDASGNFEIQGLRKGEYSLIFTKDGFNTETKAITVENSDLNVQDVILTSETFYATADESEIFVGETINLYPNTKFQEADITSIEWITDSQGILTIDNSKATGETEGTVKVSAIIHTRYGNFESQPCEIKVNKANTTLNLQVVKSGLKITLTATVKDDRNVLLSGGQVKFTITRKPDSHLQEEITNYDVDLINGTAECNLERKYLDFSGNYEFRATYLGLDGKYCPSDTVSEEKTYSNPILFYNDEHELLENGDENPLKLIYGESVSIFVKKDNLSYGFENQSEGTISVKESGDGEYIEYIIKADAFNENTSSVTFKKEAENKEVIYTNFYIQTEKKNNSYQ